MNLSEKTWLAIFAVVCLVYVSLRLWNLTASCLWFDELFSVHAATQSWNSLFWFVAQDLIHPPLFYILLKIWISVGGENLFWLRFFPVFFSIIAVIPFVLLARELKLNLSTITIALTFFAVNGSLIKYAQEVRMYSLLLCLGLFSMWLLARFLNDGKGFLFFVIVNILLVYTHYFGWFLIFAEVLAVITLRREKVKQVFLMLGLAALSFAPWIYALWQAAKVNSSVGQNIGWMTKPNVLSILQFAFDLFEPVYFEQSNTDSPAIFLITIPVVLIIATIGVLRLIVWRKTNKQEKRAIYMLAIFVFTPILLAFTLSWISPYSIWGTRHLIVVFAPATILAATLFSSISAKTPVQIASLSIIFLLFGAAFALQLTRKDPTYIWCAWENLAQDLSKSTPDKNEAVKIYTFEDLTAYHFWFALRHDSEKKFQIVKVNRIKNLIEDKAYFLPRGFDEVKSIDDFESDERFFVAFRDKEWNETKPPLKNLFEKGYRIGAPQVFKAQGLKAFLVEVKK
ncbi:MAG: glycosyltransferase family 39 protein [Acidobacteria bacterium]|nr:glycosyltransferase family 39 protein [Acidobacteriota bacterium]